MARDSRRKHRPHLHRGWSLVSGHLTWGAPEGRETGEHVTSDIWSPPEGREQGIGEKIIRFSYMNNELIWSRRIIIIFSSGDHALFVCVVTGL